MDNALQEKVTEAVERLRREGKKLREAEANRKGLVTMRPVSAQLLADDMEAAAARIQSLETALRESNEALNEANRIYVEDCFGRGDLAFKSRVDSIITRNTTLLKEPTNEA